MARSLLALVVVLGLAGCGGGRQQSVVAADPAYFLDELRTRLHDERALADGIFATDLREALPSGPQTDAVVVGTVTGVELEQPVTPGSGGAPMTSMRIHLDIEWSTGEHVPDATVYASVPPDADPQRYRASAAGLGHVVLALAHLGPRDDLSLTTWGPVGLVADDGTLSYPEMWTRSDERRWIGDLRTVEDLETAAR